MGEVTDHLTQAVEGEWNSTPTPDFSSVEVRAGEER